LEESGCSLGGRQSFILDEELFARFAPCGVEWNAGNRTQERALRLVEVPDALGAAVWIDLVKLVAHRNGFVGAFGFADVAVDAVVGNQE